MDLEPTLCDSFWFRGCALVRVDRLGRGMAVESSVDAGAEFFGMCDPFSSDDEPFDSFITDDRAKMP